MADTPSRIDINAAIIRLREAASTAGATLADRQSGDRLANPLAARRAEDEAYQELHRLLNRIEEAQTPVAMANVCVHVWPTKPELETGDVCQCGDMVFDASRGPLYRDVEGRPAGTGTALAMHDAPTGGENGEL